MIYRVYSKVYCFLVYMYEGAPEISLLVLDQLKYSGNTNPSFFESLSFKPWCLGMMLNFMPPTSSSNRDVSLTRSSRMAAATRREVSAFCLRVLNTSAAVTDAE